MTPCTRMCCPQRRPYMQLLLSPVLEHLGSSLCSALAALPAAARGAAAAATAGGHRSGAGGAPAQRSSAASGRTDSSSSGAGSGALSVPVELLAQYALDVMYLDAVLSRAGVCVEQVYVAAGHAMLHDVEKGGTAPPASVCGS